MKKLILKMDCILFNAKSKLAEKIKDEKGEFGLGSVLSVVAVLIIAAFILIPGLRSFAQSLINSLNNWWTNTIMPSIFPTN